MNNILSREIIRHIFARFGFNSGAGGIVKSTHYLISTKLPIKYDDNSSIEHVIYSARILQHSYKLDLLITDLTVDNEPEYCAIISFDNTIWSLKLVLDDDDFGSFRKYDQDHWVNLPIKEQAAFLSMLECVFDLGYPIQTNSEVDKSMLDFLKKEIH